VIIVVYFRSGLNPNNKKILLISIPFVLFFFLVGIFSVLYLPAATKITTTATPPPITTHVPSPTHFPTYTPAATPSPTTIFTTPPSSTPINTPAHNNTGSSNHTLTQFYQGTITDEDALQTTSNMFLCSVTQSGNNMNGSVKLASFSGSGPFSGSIGNDNSVRFTIINADDGYGPSTFIGSFGLNGSMSGSYVNKSLNHHGTWQVSPASQDTGTGC
jgi:hypothetical protein